VFVGFAGEFDGRRFFIFRRIGLEEDVRRGFFGFRRRGFAVRTFCFLVQESFRECFQRALF